MRWSSVVQYTYNTVFSLRCHIGIVVRWSSVVQYTYNTVFSLRCHIGIVVTGEMEFNSTVYGVISM